MTPRDAVPPWPYFDDEMIAAATAVLRSGKVNYWTGEEGRAFEAEYAAALGVPHAIALANGTVALELALRVFSVGPGDEVITASRTFIASASCVVAVGAVPVCADVDRDSQNVTVETLDACVTPSTRAVIVVHLAGWPCDMDAIASWARARDLVVIEDCAQAHGATWNGRPVGSFGDAAAFSFCQDKIITTAGEGGLLVLRDEARFEAAWAYKDHGKSYDAVSRRQHSPGFRWLHESFGTNWRLTEVQAAVGRVALRRLPGWTARRRRNAERLTAALEPLAALRVPRPPIAAGHAWYKYYVFVRPERLCAGWDRDRIMNEIVARGVPCFTGSCSEIYRERAFLDRGWGPAKRHPVARELGDTALMLQVHPTLDDATVDRAANTTAAVVSAATA